jgi:transcriptional regulator with XRE-family HTH domain
MTGVIIAGMKLLKWNQQHFKARLRIALSLRNVTQTKLAKALKVTPATVSRWQRNASNFPGLDNLAGAADFLDMEAGWLAFGTGNPPSGLAEALLSSKPERAKPRPVRGRRGKK